VIEAVPHGHWKTTTLIAALDYQGMRCAMRLDGAVNALAFQAFVRQVLVPTLRPQDVVVLDNLSSHKGVRVTDLLRAAGAELVYLPPYSPDFNPIEPAFSKVKQSLRRLATRRVNEQWGGVQPILDQVASADARGFFRHCGYTADQNQKCSSSRPVAGPSWPSGPPR
jgi:transposase